MLKQLSVFFCEFMGRDEFKVYKKAKKKKKQKSWPADVQKLRSLPFCPRDQSGEFRAGNMGSF